MIRKIESFLDAKKLPKDKKDLIVRTLQNTLTTDNINRAEDGESQLKRVFIKIVDDLGVYYKIGLNTDFTGKLFNEMYSWLGFTQDQLNDVVLTPPYVATLLCRLARVNKDSFVWDFATGSAGLLVAAMNEMLADAKKKIKSPEELARKSAEIKANQLLGLEILSNVYMLAVLNMIMMGDGSSNILNKDSLKFDGHYGFGKTDEKFPADAFILNPPYSAEGNGMIFVEKALSMMDKGYAAIIIQNSAGSGNAVEYNKSILTHSTLLASVRMPIDLFVGKSSVQTHIYVFRIGEAHQKDDIVKFIDFSNDGYTRSARKKSTNNLRDTDNAKERYQELVNLVRFGKSKMSIFTEQDYYEGVIDPENGADWNQTSPIDTKPTVEDWQKQIPNLGYARHWKIAKNCIVELPTKDGEIDFDFMESFVAELEAQRVAELSAYLTVSGYDNYELSAEELNALQRFTELDDDNWGTYTVGNLFEKIATKKLPYKAKELPKQPTDDYVLPCLTSSFQNQGLNYYAPKAGATVLNNVISIPSNSDVYRAYYQTRDFTVLSDAYAIRWKSEEIELSPNQYLFMVMCINKVTDLPIYSYKNKLGGWNVVKTKEIRLPEKNGKIDFAFMDTFISAIKKLAIKEVVLYSDRKIAATKELVSKNNQLNS